ncbi:hypothetical protein HK101_002085 [Irineochytrium annulatum]|nr:hypothetical protein HK101_002085 [Irineochytrium annulatum]
MKGYCPLLLNPNGETSDDPGDGLDEDALLKAAHRVLDINEREPDAVQAFLSRRDQLLAGVNNQMKTYFEARQSVTLEGHSTEYTGMGIAKVCADLGVGLTTFYGMVLSFEGLFDEFIGEQEQHQSRMDESLRCVQIGALLREVSRNIEI